MAKDSAHEFSDAEIRAFEREVAEVYGEASKTVYANLKRYLAQFEADDEKKRERLEAGEITKAQYRSWRSGKIAAGRRYRIVLKQCAEAMTRANVVAAAAIEGRLPEVYAENYNYGTWQVESAVGVDTAYALQDASTVQRLLTDHDSYLPKPSVNVAKDVAWNRRLIASQITQGVLLGESIPKIAERMQAVTGSNRAAAVRLARTSTTAAENSGRVDSYKRAKGLGIKVQQEWVATLDLRTRSSHREIDREKVEVGEKFSNGCRYPGDPEAPYAQTANCRCTLVACCDGLDVLDGERFSRLPEGMTYEEWKAGKPAVNGTKPANRTISEFMEMPGTKRKLDTAGVSKTEVRKRLSRQLEDYGIPSGSFRKMSAGDQQKVLDAALAPGSTPIVNGRRVFKEIKGEHSAGSDLAKVNPNFKTKKDKDGRYSCNCQRCVPAYEARRRGLDVVAKPVKMNKWGKISAYDPFARAESYKKVFPGATWKRGGDKPEKEITSFLLAVNGDARAEVSVSWDHALCGKRGRHVFVAEKAGNAIKFIDPQSGDEDVSWYFGIIKAEETEFARVDDAEFGDLIDECLTTRG
jgi:SPP1 gp7 family putative phage head morphogenesis protein